MKEVLQFAVAGLCQISILSPPSFCIYNISINFTSCAGTEKADAQEQKEGVKVSNTTSSARASGITRSDSRGFSGKLYDVDSDLMNNNDELSGIKSPKQGNNAPTKQRHRASDEWGDEDLGEDLLPM